MLLYADRSTQLRIFITAREARRISVNKIASQELFPRKSFVAPRFVFSRVGISRATHNLYPRPYSSNFIFRVRLNIIAAERANLKGGFTSTFATKECVSLQRALIIYREHIKTCARVALRCSACRRASRQHIIYYLSHVESVCTRVYVCARLPPRSRVRKLRERRRRFGALRNGRIEGK